MVELQHAQGKNIERRRRRFGAILRRLREQRGWTRLKLAQRAGLSAQYLGIVEKGGNIPSLTTVLELIEVVGGDIAEVMRELSAARNAPRAATKSDGEFQPPTPD